jgi:hypothetical protein
LGPWATANYCRAVIKSLRGTISFTGLVFCVQCSVRGQEKEHLCRAGRGGGGGSLEPRTSDRVLVLAEGLLEKLKLVLVLVELFGLLVQQL